jgi:hypothetical protein
VGFDALPTVFCLDQAVAAGVPKDRVYALRDTGELDQVVRGVYTWPGSVDPALAPLAAATLRQPRATLCLTSALVFACWVAMGSPVEVEGQNLDLHDTERRFSVEVDRLVVMVCRGR